MSLKLQLTETIPEHIEEGLLYVSLTHWTTVHKCGCGCGHKVVLRLGPKHWAITLNGESVSMYPSVGNWQLPCRSHYWIEEGRILHARKWSEETVKRNRKATKGRRTPFQTPRARLDAPLRRDEDLEISTKQSNTYVEANRRIDFNETMANLERLDRDGANGVLSRWWYVVKTNLQRTWKKALVKCGVSHDS